MPKVTIASFEGEEKAPLFADATPFAPGTRALELGTEWNMFHRAIAEWLLGVNIRADRIAFKI